MTSFTDWRIVSAIRFLPDCPEPTLWVAASHLVSADRDGGYQGSMIIKQPPEQFRQLNAAKLTNLIESLHESLATTFPEAPVGAICAEMRRKAEGVLA